MRMINVYHRQGKFYVLAKHKTVDPVYMDVDPVHVLPDDDRAALCRALRHAIADYEEGLPRPDGPSPSRVARAAGLKSGYGFMRTATQTCVEMHGASVTLIAFPRGARGDEDGEEILLEFEEQTLVEQLADWLMAHMRE
jgi:hypothetical protein